MTKQPAGPAGPPNRVSTPQELSPEATECRAFGHVWKPRTAVHYSAPKFKFKGYQVTLQCTRCGCIKYFLLSEKGEYYRASYSYPQDYLMDHFADKKERGMIRMEAVKHYMTIAESSVTQIRA